MAGIPPRDAITAGIISEISMRDYQVDRGAIQEALGINGLNNQQGGDVGTTVRPHQQLQHPVPQQPFGGKPISGWRNPWGKNG